MNEQPARGLPPRIYVPMLMAILVIFGIPIAAFLQRGFGTNGSTLSSGNENAAPPPVIAKVVGELQTRIAKNPRDVEALESLAGLEMDIGKIGAAAKLQGQAVVASPKDPAIRALYAQSLTDLGDLTAALEQVSVLLTLDPKNADGFFERGTIEERLGRHDAADHDYATFLRLAPANDPRRTQVTGHSGS